MISEAKVLRRTVFERYYHIRDETPVSFKQGSASPDFAIVQFTRDVAGHMDWAEVTLHSDEFDSKLTYVPVSGERKTRTRRSLAELPPEFLLAFDLGRFIPE